MLVQRANSIDHWVEDCRDVTKAGGGGYVQRMEVIVKRKKVRGGGGQGRCERRSEAFVDIQKKIWWGGGRVEGGGGGGGQGGCELRSEAFVKIQKKKHFFFFFFFFFFWGGVGLGDEQGGCEWNLVGGSG